MHLYRAFAYQIQPLETYHADVQPEVMVFFESHTPDAAPATLARLLALAWGCTPADVEHYNLHSEGELRDHSDAPGDAALWETGYSHGPLFHRADRTLMFVRPSTLTRLLQARQATLPLRALQQRALLATQQAERERERQRIGFASGLSRALRGEQRAHG